MAQTKRTPLQRRELLECLRAHYVYDSATGGIRHKKHDKPRKQSSSCYRSYQKYNISVNGKYVNVHAHLAVWLVCKGRWPEGAIDHIDGDGANNRIENLRECSYSENNCNMLHPWRPNKDTGVPGVYVASGRIRTYIRGRLLCFRDPYQAFYYAMLCGKRYR